MPAIYGHGELLYFFRQLDRKPPRPQCGLDGVAKLVLYTGKPMTYQGHLVYGHEYSDYL